jgi:high affinity Mn2+ porin
LHTFLKVSKLFKMQFNSIIHKFSCLAFTLLLSEFSANSQSKADTSLDIKSWNFHFQNTVITQYHPTFNSGYSGRNSLSSSSESPTSVTATMFFGIKLTENTRVYFNPELAGGAGFSATTGIAGFPNGEVTG